MLLSYARWGDFEIRMPTYLDGRLDYDKFDIVKWKNVEPYEAVDLLTGEKKTHTAYCYSIASLEWDDQDGISFRSIGTRYLKDRVDGLEDFILKFIKAEEYKRENRRD